MPVPVDPTTCAAPRRRAGARDSGPRAWEPGEHTRAFKCFSQAKFSFGHFSQQQQQPARDEASGPWSLLSHRHCISKRAQ